jgi:hypothetical protein
MEDIFEALLVDEHKPFDVAVDLMAQGFYLNELEGHPPMFDPYFND